MPRSFSPANSLYLTSVSSGKAKITSGYLLKILRYEKRNLTFEKELEVREMPFLTPESLPVFNQVESSKACALFIHSVPLTTSQAFVRLLDIILDSLPSWHRHRKEPLVSTSSATAVPTKIF